MAMNQKMFKEFLKESHSEFIEKAISKKGATTLLYEGNRVRVYYHSQKDPKEIISPKEMIKIDKSFSNDKVNSLKKDAKKFEQLFDQLFTNLGTVAKTPERKVDVIFVDYPLKDDSGKVVRVYVEYFENSKQHVIFFNNSVIGQNFLLHWLLHEYAHVYLMEDMKEGARRKIKKFIDENLVGKDPEQLIKDKWIVREYSLKSYEQFFADTIMALAWDSYGLNDEVVRMIASIL